MQPDEETQTIQDSELGNEAETPEPPTTSLINETISPEKNIRAKEDVNTPTTPRPSPIKEGKYLFVAQAGLVLLHPYFRIIFKEFELITEDGQFPTPRRTNNEQCICYII